MSKFVGVKTGSLAEIRSWIEAKAKFSVKHGEAFGDHIRWSKQRFPVSLKIFENKAITWAGFGGYPYGHYEGGCIWARYAGSEHKIALFVDKTSFKKPRKRRQPQPVTPASDHFKINDVVMCGNHWSPSTFVQITSVSSEKGVVTGRVLDSNADGRINCARLNVFLDDKEHRFVTRNNKITHENTVCLRQVATNATSKGAPGRKCNVSDDGYFHGYPFSDFMD